MKTAAVGIGAALLTLACTTETTGGSAGACGSVVEYYRGLPGPVEVLGNPLQTATGAVEIRYRGTNGENLPVQGEAACEFSTGSDGSLRLLSATVDGEPLAGGAVSTMNRAGFPR